MINREPQKNLKISCPGCEQKLDLSDIPVFTRVQCPECAMDIVVPRRFGQYLLEEPIGESAIAGVYRALEMKLDRQVAVKILSQALCKDKHNVDIFLAVSRQMAALNYPNIIPIYSCDEQEKQPFLVMEYMPAHSTAQLLTASGGSIPMDRCLTIAEQAARGLDNANREGVSHFNIKPANLLLGEDGNIVKVSDFRMSAVAGEGNSDDTVTDEGYRVDPRYASPEMLVGENKDYRSDIFSLSATLYHLLTGQAPFPRDLAERLDGIHTFPEQSPNALRPEVPLVMSDLIMQSLSPDPEHRPHTYKTIIQIVNSLNNERQGADRKRPAVVPKKQAKQLRVKPLNPPVRKNQRAPMVNSRPTSARRQKSAKSRVLTDLIILLCVIAAAVLMIVAARQRAPWYVRHVEPIFQRFLPAKTDVEPQARPAPLPPTPVVENQRQLPVQANFTELDIAPLLRAFAENEARHPQPPSVTMSQAENRLPTPQPEPPAAMHLRPQPADLDLVAVAPAVKDYLRQQKPDMYELEKERALRVAGARPYLTLLMQRLTYTGTTIELRNGTAVQGRIKLVDAEGLTVDSGPQRNRRIPWDDIGLQQYIKFFDFYIQKRLSMAGTLHQGHGNPRHDAAQDSLLTALLCDWYGQRSQAVKYAADACRQDPRLKAQADRFLYYLPLP